MLRPERFDVSINSSSAAQEWVHWFMTFENYISSVQDVTDHQKLQLLINFVSHSVFELIAGCTTYDDAINNLKSVYIKRKNEIYARHKLASRKQQPGESIDSFVQTLRLLSQDCNFAAVSAEDNRSEYIRDAFISGLSSTEIRQRLLENVQLTLQSAVDQARALETAKQNADLYFQPLEHANAIQNSITPQIEDKHCAAITKFSQGKCFFCGRSRHARNSCPARDAKCYGCGKQGHWNKVCRSQKISNSRNSDSRQTSASIIPNLSAAVCSSLQKSSMKVMVNNVQADALVDTGSTESFINKNFAETSRIKIFPSKSTIYMANTSLTSNTSGHCFINLELQGHIHQGIKISVLPALCADIVLGHDVLNHHSSLEMKFNGDKPPIKLCCVSQAKVEPPSLFTNLSPNCRPVATKSRKHSAEDEAFIQVEVLKLLNDDVIEESQSPWRAQVLVTRNERHKKRLVIDYSQTINRFTYLDAYPLPSIEEIINKVSQAKFFSTIDLKSAYHQVPIRESEKQYTAFEANGRLYQFRRIPFGVTNGVAAFQRVVDGIILKEKLEGVFAYLDDVTICGNNKDQHDKNLIAFMTAANKYGLTLNNDKCAFSQTSIRLLGYLIENGTLKPDPDRLQPLLQFPVPTNSSSLKRCIGMFAHYAKWVPKFSEKVHPLVNAKSFPLTAEAVSAFETLKNDISESVVSSVDLNSPFTVETDASDHAIAATLSQNDRPVAFFTRTLSNSELKHSAIEKEACAIVEALKKWRHYLLGRHFKLITDQRSLSYMFDHQHTSKIKNDKIQRWRLELSGYSYDIVYRPGVNNVAADSFSRMCGSTSNAQTLLQLHQNLCHPGVTRMFHWVRNRNLPFSLQEVKNITSSCNVCAEIKPRFENRIMGHIIKATSPFERLNIDFKGPLPTNSKNSYLLTIVDEFSRFPFAIPCPDVSANSVIRSLDTLFAVFGAPTYIHSDRGASFMSNEVKTYLHSLGTATSHTTPYNPRGNGQAERFNGTIWKAVTLALKTRNLKITEWESVLDMALHSVRSLLCTAINSTPHERMFRHPRRTATGVSMPSWLIPGPVFLKRQVRHSKYEPIVDVVDLLEANPNYAVVRNRDGRESTVSIRHLAPVGSEVIVENNENPECILEEDCGPNPTNKVVPDDISDQKRTSERTRKPPSYLKDYVLN